MSTVMTQPINHIMDTIKNISSTDIKGAKLFFINMPLRESALPNCLPTGICTLASRVMSYGAIPTIIDLNAYRIRDGEAFTRGLPNGRYLSVAEVKTLYQQYIKKYGEPSVVALSGMITTLKWQEIVARMVKEVTPDAFLVSGGGLATEIKEHLFKWIPELDAIGTSEGEVSIIKIILDAVRIKKYGFQNLMNSGKLDPYYIGKIKNRHRFYYDGSYACNLDKLPIPSYDLLESDVNGKHILSEYMERPVWGAQAANSSVMNYIPKRSLNMVSSRGCPFSCRFCYKNEGSTYSITSAERLWAEIEFYRARYSIDFIALLDDNFMVDKKRVFKMAILAKNYSHGTNFKWGTHARLDDVAGLDKNNCFNNRLAVDAMAEAGCTYIGFGGESANPKMLQEMGKGGQTLSHGVRKINGYTFPVSMIEGIRNTKHAGIHANCTWIAGYPGETLEQLKTTVAFIMWQAELNNQKVNKDMFVATAYPGTKMFEYPIVKKELKNKFGIHYDKKGSLIYDKYLHDYILKLGDATDLIYGSESYPLYYGAMHIEQFLLAKDYIDSGKIERILEMK